MALGTGSITLQQIIDEITAVGNAGPDALAQDGLSEAFVDARANAPNGFVPAHDVNTDERMSEFRGFGYQDDNSVTYNIGVGFSSGTENPSTFGTVIGYTINVTPDTSTWSVSVNYTDGSGWITLETPTSGTGDVTNSDLYNVTVANNLGGTERVATLRFRNTSTTGVEVFRTITQEGESGGGGGENP